MAAVEKEFGEQFINRFKVASAQSNRKKSTAGGFFCNQPTVADFGQLRGFTARCGQRICIVGLAELHRCSVAVRFCRDLAHFHTDA